MSIFSKGDIERAIWMVAKDCGCAFVGETGEQVIFCPAHLFCLRQDSPQAEALPAEAASGTPPRS